ncbi:hypothetical protein FQN54_007575 [Arachnomyces sp. PD_36]|nr:hypothetical protein FQN54_007575 [Arachnomyces sp. PD_36]
MKFSTALKLPFFVVRLLFNIFHAALVGLVRRPKSWSLFRHIQYTVLRTAYKDRGIFALVTERGSTIKVYRTYMKKIKSEPEVIDLGDGACGGWIGSSKAKNVLLYLHGGGYINPAHPKHIEMLGELVKAGKKQGKDFSVFAVEYGLAPNTQYPKQMIQGTSALKYLIETAGFSPENILLSGDSAGGNLSCAVLSCLSHPHPATATIDLGGKKLAGVFFISPWMTFETDRGSMITNADKDYLDAGSIDYLGDKFLGGAKKDPYNEPLSADPEWWQDLPVKDICILGAEYEMLVDSIKDWAAKVKVHNPDAELYIAPAEVHVQQVSDRGLFLGVAKSEVYFSNWILSRV